MSKHAAAQAVALEGDPRASLSGQDYRALLPGLRFNLLDAQHAMKAAGVPVVVVVAGADAVKADAINALHAWLDPRGVKTHAFDSAYDPEPGRPRFAPFNEALPPKGAISLFCGSWYSALVTGRLERSMGRELAGEELQRIAFFERMLTDAGTLVVKVWLHLDEHAQQARLKRLASDPRTSWKVTESDWKRLKLFGRLGGVRDAVFAVTHQPNAPWVLLDAGDDRYCHYMLGQAVLGAMRERLSEGRGAVEPEHPFSSPSAPDRLGAVDLGARLSEGEYDDRLGAARAKLLRLSQESFRAGRSHVIAFEGWDAAGKGGAIRRMVEALDARNVSVVPVGAPTAEEAQRHYLWRFWRYVPRDGHITVFDRSWYGRVLVERVEGFASEPEWRRAYAEIRDFEAHLASHGTTVTKFWLHVSPDEQLRRFTERENTPYKQHKITEEDWRNREKFPEYYEAVNDMLAMTDRPPQAPWFVVPSEDKLSARVQVIETVVSRMERALQR